MILGVGVAVCLLLSVHRAVIFGIAQLSCFMTDTASVRRHLLRQAFDH